MSDTITRLRHLDKIADEIFDEAGTCDADYAFVKAAAQMIYNLRTALEAAEKALLKEEVYSEELESQLQDAESEYNANWAVQAISDVARLVGVYEQCQGTGDDIGEATLEAVQDLKAENARLTAERDWLAAELAELHDTSLMLVDGAPEGSNRAPYWKEAARRAVSGVGE